MDERPLFSRCAGSCAGDDGRHNSCLSRIPRSDFAPGIARFLTPASPRKRCVAYQDFAGLYFHVLAGATLQRATGGEEFVGATVAARGGAWPFRSAKGRAPRLRHLRMLGNRSAVAANSSLSPVVVARFRVSENAALGRHSLESMEGVEWHYRARASGSMGSRGTL